MTSRSLPQPFRLPPPLPVGATVALIAPAGPSPKAAEAEAALASLGWTVRVYPSCRESKGFLAGDDARRAADLWSALTDPEIDGVFAIRGGYGCGRLLDKLDWSALAAPKVFVGYSDLTALHVVLNRQGWVTYHGPMAAADLIHKQEPTRRHLLSLLRGELKAGDSLFPDPLTSWSPGMATGRLAGGNLAILLSLMATPYQADLRGTILFLEDVSEPPYRIDRFMNQLRLAGCLQQLAGVLVGDFAPLGGTHRHEIDAVLREYLTPLGIPVLAGLQAGHCDPNLTVPLGMEVVLDAGQGVVRLAEQRRGA